MVRILILDGSARRPGLWLMGQLVEPVRLFQDMQQTGVEVTTTSVETGASDSHSSI